MRWQLGEPLILSDELEAEAERRRAAHTERDPLQGQIEAFLEQPVPADWQNWDAGRRAMYWGGGQKSGVQTVPRDRICAAEIWRECLGNRIPMSKTDARRINEILSVMDGWEQGGLQRFGGEYGRQRGFRRKIGVNITPESCQHSHGFVNMCKNMDVNNVNNEKQEC